MIAFNRWVAVTHLVRACWLCLDELPVSFLVSCSENSCSFIELKSKLNITVAEIVSSADKLWLRLGQTSCKKLTAVDSTEGDKPSYSHCVIALLCNLPESYGVFANALETRLAAELMMECTASKLIDEYNCRNEV